MDINQNTLFWNSHRYNNQTVKTLNRHNKTLIHNLDINKCVVLLYTYHQNKIK